MEVGAAPPAAAIFFAFYPIFPHLSNILVILPALGYVPFTKGIEGWICRGQPAWEPEESDAVRQKIPFGDQGSAFVALDFETADFGRDSACALALVRVEDHRVTTRRFFLIRPPRRRFYFSYLHGITWEDVADQPHFGELWPEITPLLKGARFLAAHNAPFDRGVLAACCARYGLEPPALPFLCTVELARRTWGLRRANLPHVCNFLGIPLTHHDAASDAEACARIVLAALRVSK